MVKNGGRRLVPTRLGIVLVQGYLRIDPDLILPKIRSNIEDQCSLIASGAATKEDVVEHSLKHFLLKFNYFCNNISRMVKFMVVVVVVVVVVGVGGGGGGCCCTPMPVSNLETMFDY